MVPINWIDESDRCVIISGYENKRKSPRLKELRNRKGSCYFTRGVSKKCVDFVYRSVKRLGFEEKKLLFSRGAVKKNGMAVLNAIEVKELDWDVGVSIKIPARLSYEMKIDLIIEGERHTLRLMEIIVLNGLLRLAMEKKSDPWYADMAAAILALGWGVLERGEPPEVMKIKNN